MATVREIANRYGIDVLTTMAILKRHDVEVFSDSSEIGAMALERAADALRASSRSSSAGVRGTTSTRLAICDTPRVHSRPEAPDSIVEKAGASTVVRQAAGPRIHYISLTPAVSSILRDLGTNRRQLVDDLTEGHTRILIDKDTRKIVGDGWAALVGLEPGKPDTLQIRLVERLKSDDSSTAELLELQARFEFRGPATKERGTPLPANVQTLLAERTAAQPALPVLPTVPASSHPAVPASLEEPSQETDQTAAASMTPPPRPVDSTRSSVPAADSTDPVEEGHRVTQSENPQTSKEPEHPEIFEAPLASTPGGDGFERIQEATSLTGLHRQIVVTSLHDRIEAVRAAVDVFETPEASLPEAACQLEAALAGLHAALPSNRELEAMSGHVQQMATRLGVGEREPLRIEGTATELVTWPAFVSAVELSTRLSKTCPEWLFPKPVRTVADVVSFALTLARDPVTRNEYSVVCENLSLLEEAWPDLLHLPLPTECPVSPLERIKAAIEEDSSEARLRKQLESLPEWLPDAVRSSLESRLHTTEGREFLERSRLLLAHDGWQAPIHADLRNHYISKLVDDADYVARQLDLVLGTPRALLPGIATPDLMEALARQRAEAPGGADGSQTTSAGRRTVTIDHALSNYQAGRLQQRTARLHGIELEKPYVAVHLPVTLRLDPPQQVTQNASIVVKGAALNVDFA